MNVIKPKCEFCAFYEDDFYETHCLTCRVDKDSPTDNRNFILLPELVELKRLAEIGRAAEKAFEHFDLITTIKFLDKEYEEQEEQFVDTQKSRDFDGLEDLLEWAKGVSND